VNEIVGGVVAGVVAFVAYLAVVYGVAPWVERRRRTRDAIRRLDRTE
jgi:uncharacterized protein (DUF2062 family)